MSFLSHHQKKTSCIYCAVYAFCTTSILIYKEAGLYSCDGVKHPQLVVIVRIVVYHFVSHQSEMKLKWHWRGSCSCPTRVSLGPRSVEHISVRRWCRWCSGSCTPSLSRYRPLPLRCRSWLHRQTTKKLWQSFGCRSSPLIQMKLVPTLQEIGQNKFDLFLVVIYRSVLHSLKETIKKPCFSELTGETFFFLELKI